MMCAGSMAFGMSCPRLSDVGPDRTSEALQSSQSLASFVRYHDSSKHHPQPLKNFYDKCVSKDVEMY